MKIIKELCALVFALIIIIPIIFFNFNDNAISEIDNRMLAPKPFSEEASGAGIPDSIDNYVSDRIGFRSEMINTYNVLNDRLFDKLVHPIYSYGKDGYIFGGGVSVSQFYGEYQEVFADMVQNIQQYCDERNTPFLFVFEPAKPAVMQEYLPDGLNYDRSWVDQFLADIYSRGINCLDNTTVLREKFEEGIPVFNKKYDAGHWNSLGAFYGTEAMLQELSKIVPGVHINTFEELEISTANAHTLPVSNFVVDEEIPVINIPMELEDLSYVYDEELYRDCDNTTFAYFRNQERLKENAPRVLVFQGSYMNGHGKQFFKNSFGEYIYIHDYQNIINFPYYYNLFRPDAVIFEVGEYTFHDIYFDSERMSNINYNQSLSTLVNSGFTDYHRILNESELEFNCGDKICNISWSTDVDYDHVWIILDKEYDMFKSENKYVTSVLKEDYINGKNNIQIICLLNNELNIYSNSF